MLQFVQCSAWTAEHSAVAEMSKGESNVERRMEKKTGIEGDQLTSMLYKFQGAQLIHRELSDSVPDWDDTLAGLFGWPARRIPGPLIAVKVPPR